MSDPVILPVTSRRERKLFLNFPWSHYRDDPHWIPPLRANQKAMVGFAHHPFYERNLAQAFLALRDGEVCGRILAIVNYGHIERHDDRRGFFGFFESVDDPQVSAGLFDAARAWLAQHDLRSLRGPANPSGNYELGLLIDGFDSPPTFMMTYNPPYYAKLIEAYGFRKSQDLYAYVGTLEQLPKAQAKYLPIIEEMLQEHSVSLRPLNRKRFREDVEMFLDVFNRSCMNTWGFVPMTPGEVKHTAAELRHLIVPDLAVAAEIDGRPIGVVFCLPDYNPRIRRIDGRLFPFGFLKLLNKQHEIKRMRVISANVLPEYQHQGLGLVLLHGLVPRVIEWGIQETEFSWVMESNRLSWGSLERGGTKRTKTYRLYDWDPPAAG